LNIGKERKHKIMRKLRAKKDGKGQKRGRNKEAILSLFLIHNIVDVVVDKTKIICYIYIIIKHGSKGSNYTASSLLQNQGETSVPSYIRVHHE